MKNSWKWICVSTLAAAGVLSLVLSFFGILCLLWTGLPNSKSDALTFGISLPLILAFPVFSLAVSVTKFANLALWIMAVIPWIVLVRTSMSHHLGGPLDFLALVVACLFNPIAMPLLCLAALVQFGNHFYEFTRDRRWVRWKEPKHAPAA